MGTSTFSNGRGIAHKRSGGTSAVFPDVCKTPTPSGPVPLPYPNVGRSADTTGGPKSVRVDGVMPMVKDATYRTTTGDEAGTLGGVISGSTTYFKGRSRRAGHGADIDPHAKKGDPGHERYDVIITDDEDPAALKSAMRRYVEGYGGSWSWRFEAGQNCHTFQRGMLDAAGIRKFKKV
jgi:hypothetical protein